RKASTYCSSAQSCSSSSKKLASEVSGHSNEEQNTIYSVLINLREMVHEQDYGSDKYVGTVIEPIAARLASLCQGMALYQPTGGMKKKPGKRVGPSAKHRLGSEKSTVSRLPYKCGFCGGSGDGTSYHSSSTNCPVKQSWGDVSVEIKKTDHTEVNSAMKSIFSGAHDFIHVGALGDLSSHKRVDQLPTGTKHLQILGYANVDKSDSPLLFACANEVGCGDDEYNELHLCLFQTTHYIYSYGILVKSKRMGKDQAKIIHDNIGSDSDSSEEQTIASLKKTGAKRQSSKTKQAPKKRIKQVTRSGAN
ncbi:hypothetical protein ACHAWO_013494, partial [Cyclotella atomus]